MSAIRRTGWLFVLAALGATANMRAAPAPSGGCFQCMAIYHVGSGRVLQTCPGGYSGGGNSCNIQGDACRTVGVCTP